MIKAIIFDLDGTTLNTIEDLTGSVNYALEKNGYSKRTIEDCLRFIGNGVWKLLQRALPQGTDKDIIDTCLADFKVHYNVHKADNTKPYPGIIDLVQKLKKDGYKMAVVSNKYNEAVNELCQVFEPYIKIFVGEGPLIPKKPDTTGTRVAMNLLGVEKDEIIYVGDSPVDYQLMDALGCKGILVNWGFAPNKIVDLPVAKVNDTKELYDLIKQMS